MCSAWTTRAGAVLVPMALLVPEAVAGSAADEVRRLKNALEVLRQLTSAPDDAIPKFVLDRAEAIVVIPELVKGGFVVGAEHGKGVMSVRLRERGGWSAPSFVKMTGGSVGWQIGLQSVDVVLVVTNREGVDKLLKSEFTLGANASVAAGPVGRSAEASTDALMHAKILAYSRARGLFAGATVEGASLRSDDGANRDFYGREVSVVEVVGRGGSVPAMPAAGQEWRDGLARLVGSARAAR